MLRTAAALLALLLVLSVSACRDGEGETTLQTSAPGSGATSTLLPAEPQPVWRELSPGVSPSARYGGWFIGDARRRISVLLGGTILYDGASASITEMWEWNEPAGTWVERAPDEVPGLYIGASVVYDIKSSLFLAIAGGGTEADTRRTMWTWDGEEERWSSSESSQGPFPIGSSAAYHETSGKTVLFGGSVQSQEETWSYDLPTDTWTLLEPEVSPPGRSWASMVYDPGREVMVLFGGLGERGVLNDTWVYDPKSDTWTEQRPFGAWPAARMGAAMAYDPELRKVVLSGGVNGASLPPARGGAYEGVLGDTWVYEPEAGTWTELDTPGPAPRAFAYMTHDLTSKSIVLFGGYGSDGPLGDTWRLAVTDQISS